MSFVWAQPMMRGAAGEPEGPAEQVAALLRFAAGGVLSAGVTLSVTAVLHEIFSVSEPKAAAFAMLTALSVNYVFLRYIAFPGTHVPWQRQLLLFFASTGIFRGIEYLAFLAVNVWLGVHYLVALMGVMGASFLLKFTVYDRFVFARRTGTTGGLE